MPRRAAWLSFAGLRIPVSRHVGSMGVAPPLARGALSTIPPDVHGGNLDTVSVGAGATVLFPVHVPGALFSLGDLHAAQGEGEVCGTAVEVAGNVTVRLTVLKRAESADARSVTEWQIRTPGRLRAGLLRPGRDGRRFVTTGFAPELKLAAQKAVWHMTDVLRAHRPGLSREQALMVVSLAGDLRISQAVDMPHYSVAAHLPAGVLE